MSAAGTSGPIGAERSKALATSHGRPELLRLALQVAAGHVERDAVAVHAAHRSLDRDVGAAGTERDGELDLVVHILAAGRIGKLARGIEVVGFFWKKNGGSRSGS